VKRPAALASPLVTALLLAGLTACGGGGSSSSGAAPADALATAKSHLDATSGVHVTLATSDLPSGVTAPTKADGVLTRAPAFSGSITVPVLGVSASVAVVAVDGTVWAKLPFTSSYQTIDPAKFGVPDPAALLDPTDGISALLAESTGATKGSSQRGGEDNRSILTEYDATVPGDAVAKIIHGATGDFQAKYTVDDAGDLEAATLTGRFAGQDKPAFTYTVTLSDYGTTQEITAP
jgi:lipoprotein LprG